MSRARSTVVGAAMLVGAALVPGKAAAFSDANLFAAKNAAGELQPGGGLGRFFTGSPADGYTCKVCHHGGQGPGLRILGLPLSGYRPDTQYEVTIDWPDNFLHIALEVELTDQTGVAAGRLKLPPNKELPASEQCQPAPPPPAPPFGAGQYADPQPANRIVIQVVDCGAQQLRFLWTAPAQDVGPVWLAGTVVSSDTSTTPEGDGVTEFTRVIGSPTSSSAKASDTSGGCSVRAPARGAPRSLTSLGIVAWTLALLLRRRGSAARRA